MLPIQFEGESVTVDTTRAISHVLNGIPRTAAGRIAVTDDGTPVHFQNGLPFDEYGRLCVEWVLPPYTNAISMLDAPGRHPAFSHTRTTVGALCQQFDGSFYQPEIGEIGSHGMRRVQNVRSNTLTTQNSPANNRTIDDTAKTVQLTVTDGSYSYWRPDTLGSQPAGTKWFVRAKISCPAGERTIGFRVAAGGGDDAEQVITVNATKQEFTLSFTQSLAGVPEFGLDNRSAVVAGVNTATGTFTFEDLCIYKARPGQTVMDPEIVTLGVLSAPHHGWGIDGVRCFATDEYGNDLTIGLGPERTGISDLADGTDPAVGAVAYGWVAYSAPDTVEILNGTDLHIVSNGNNQGARLNIANAQDKRFRIAFEVVGDIGSIVISNATDISASVASLAVQEHEIEFVATAATVSIYFRANNNLVTPGETTYRGLTVREVYPVRAAGAVRNPAVTNLWEYANPPTGNVSGGGLLTDAAGFAGLPRSLHFVDNAQNRYSYRTFTLTGSHVVQVVLKMDDGAAPVPGNSNTSSFDFLMTFESAAGTHGATPNVESLGGGLYRVWMTFAATGISGNYGLVKYAGNSARGFKVLLFQVHAGTEPLPFVLTNGASVAVAADASPLDKTELGYDDAGGTLVVVSKQFAASDDQQIVSAAGAAGESWSIGATHTVVDGGVTQASIADSWSAGDRVIHAVRIEANDIRVDADGANVGSDASATMPTITGLSLGGGSHSQAIEAVYYFPPGTITDAQLLAMSAGDLPNIPELA